MKSALELLPNEGLGEHFAGVKDNETTIGLVEHAGLDEVKVRGQRAKLCQMLDATEHRRVLGHIFVDHRRAFGSGAIGDYVNLKSPERRRPAKLISNGDSDRRLRRFRFS